MKNKRLLVLTTVLVLAICLAFVGCVKREGDITDLPIEDIGISINYIVDGETISSEKVSKVADMTLPTSTRAGYELIWYMDKDMTNALDISRLDITGGTVNVYGRYVSSVVRVELRFNDKKYNVRTILGSIEVEKGQALPLIDYASLVVEGHPEYIVTGIDYAGGAIDSDTAINVTYDYRTYSLRVVDGESETLRDVQYGDSVTIAHSDSSLMEFEGWLDENGAVVDMATFTMPARDMTITAKYKTSSIGAVIVSDKDSLMYGDSANLEVRLDSVASSDIVDVEWYMASNNSAERILIDDTNKSSIAVTPNVSGTNTYIAVVTLGETGLEVEASIDIAVTKADASVLAINWLESPIYTGNIIEPKFEVVNTLNGEVLDESYYSASFGDDRHNLVDVNSGIIVTVKMKSNVVNYMATAVLTKECDIAPLDLTDSADSRLEVEHDSIYTGNSVIKNISLYYGDTKVNATGKQTFTNAAGAIVEQIVDAGTYSIAYDITGGGDTNFVGVVTSSIAVAKADVEIFAENTTLTYDAKPHSIDYNASFDVALDAKVADKDFDSATNAGVYEIHITFGGDTNLNKAEKIVTLTIAKATSDITLANAEYVYASRDLFDDLAFDVTNSEQVVSADKVDIVNVGEYEVTARALETANYNAITKTFNIIVNTRDVEVTAPSMAGVFDYDMAGFDTTKRADTKGLLSGDTLDITLDLYRDGVLAVSPLDAGTYDVVATVTPNKNYTIKVNNGTFEVSKKTLTTDDVIVEGISDLVYNGDAQAVTVRLRSAKPSDSMVILANGKEPNIVNAGGYVLSISMLSATNYTLENSLNVATFEVARLAVNIPTISTNTKVYDGETFAVASAPEYAITYRNNTGDIVPSIVDAGKYTIVASLTNANYIWSDRTLSAKEFEYTITKADLALIWGNTSMQYNFGEQCATATLPALGDTLSVVVTGGASDVGTYTATATLAGEKKGNYTLTNDTVEYTIFALDASASDVVLSSEPHIYDGKEQTIATVTASIDGHDVDTFTIDYADNVSAGTATIRLTFDTNFVGVVERTFKIAKATPVATATTISMVYGEKTWNDIALSIALPSANGIEIDGVWQADNEPALVVGKVNNSLTFTPSDTNNYNDVTMNVTVDVSRLDISSAVIVDRDSTNLVYTGNAIEPKYSVTLDGVSLSSDRDYTITYENNTNAGTATATIDFGMSQNYTGTKVETFTITPASGESATAVMDSASLVYSGEAIEPTYSVSLGDKILSAGSDYDIEYLGDRVNVGKVNANIVMKGNYKGTKAVTYDITPLAVSVEAKGAQLLNLSDNVALATYLDSIVLSHSVVSATFLGEVDSIVNSAVLGATDRDGTAVSAIDIVGEYSLTADFGDNKNYSFTLVPFAFRVVAVNAYVSIGGAPVLGSSHNVTYLDDTSLNIRHAKGIDKDSVIEGITYAVTVDGVVTESMPTKVGSYEIVVTLDSTSYLISDNNEMRFSLIIDKAKVTSSDYTTTMTFGEKSWLDIIAEIPMPTYNASPVSGTWSVGDESVILDAGKVDNTATFTPHDSASYEPITIAISVDVASLDISLSAVVEKIDDVVYSAKAHNIEPVVRYNDIVLTKDVDYTLTYRDNVDVGLASVDITMTGNYKGTKTVTFAIVELDASSAGVAKIENVTFSGKAQMPDPVIMMNGIRLVKDVDYKLTYVGNENVGDARIDVAFIGNYKGTSSVTFHIDTLSISDAIITILDESIVYNGEAKKPSIEVTSQIGGGIMPSDTYDVEYLGDLVNATSADATIKVTMKGNYSGSQSKIFTIAPLDASGAVIDPLESVVYSAKANEIEPTITMNGTILAVGRDYTLAYSENVSVGKATIDISFKDNYRGTAKATFDITPRDASSVKIEIEPTYSLMYSGVDVEPPVSVTLGDTMLVQGVDYDIAYSGDKVNVTAQGVDIVITPKGNYNGSTSQINYKIAPKTFSDISIALVDSSTITYSGEAIEPNVTVTGDGVLMKSGDYIVTYAKNVNAGVADISVTMQGNYKGAKVVHFTIEKLVIDSITTDLALNKAYTGAVANVTSEELAGHLSSGQYAIEDYTYVVKSGIVAGDDIVVAITFAENANFSSIAPIDVVVGKVTKATLDNFVGDTYHVPYGDSIESVAITTICMFRGNEVHGAYNWLDTSALGSAGTSSVRKIHFVPLDTTNFDEVDIDATVIVDKKNITGAVLAVDNKAFTGAKIEPSVTLTYEGKTIPSIEYDVDATNIINSGEYDVAVTLKDSGNYTTSAKIKARMTVDKATLTSSNMNKTEIAFNDYFVSSWQDILGIASSEIVVTFNGMVVGGVWSYLDVDGAIGSAVRQMRFVPNNANYKALETAVTFTLDTSNVVLTSMDVAPLVYNGLDQTPSFTTKVGNKNITSSDYTLKKSVSTNVGEYSATITFKDGTRLVGDNADGTLTLTYRISPYVITNDQIMTTAGDVTLYNGYKVISHDIKYGDKLTLGVDGWNYTAFGATVTKQPIMVKLVGIDAPVALSTIIYSSSVVPAVNSLGKTHLWNITKLNESGNFVFGEGVSELGLLVKVKSVEIGKDSGILMTIEDAISELNAKGGEAYMLADTTFSALDVMKIYGLSANIAMTNGTLVLPYEMSAGTLHKVIEDMTMNTDVLDRALTTKGTSMTFTVPSYITNIDMSGTASIYVKSRRNGGWNGSVTGKDTRLVLESGAKVTLNSPNARLDVTGYIIGGGEIVARKGLLVDTLAIGDCVTGGSLKAGMWQHGKFLPFKQFTVNNIETKTTIYRDAYYGGHWAFTADDKVYAGVSNIVAPDNTGLFESTRAGGYIVKTFDNFNSYYDLSNGDYKINAIKLSLSLKGIINIDLDSSVTIMPIPGNMRFNLKSGSTLYVDKEIMLLPGAVFNVEENAKLTIAPKGAIYMYQESMGGNAYSQLVAKNGNGNVDYVGSSGIYPITHMYYRYDYVKAHTISGSGINAKCTYDYDIHSSSQLIIDGQLELLKSITEKEGLFGTKQFKAKIGGIITTTKSTGTINVHAEADIAPVMSEIVSTQYVNPILVVSTNKNVTRDTTFYGCINDSTTRLSVNASYKAQNGKFVRV